jgi:hypothetical protein
MQGSALRRTSDPAAAKIPFSERTRSGTRSVLLDYGVMASLPEEPGYAGVCPTASL